jgi:endonuclease-3
MQPQKAMKIIRLLQKSYPQAECELDYASPLELLVATILSAQSTDKMVNLITPALFKKCRQPSDYYRLSTGALEKLIHSSGFYRAKAKSIQGACRMIDEKFDGKVPKTLEELIQLPGVGRKTANVVLGNAFGVPGITTDTHVMRLSQRLGFTKQKDPGKIEIDLQKLLPQKDWTLDCHVLIFHGRRCCYARKPNCPECPVLKLCPYKEKTTPTRSSREA